MIISIFNQKGGCGKTSTCLSIVSFIADMGLRVLVIDMDPQANTTAGLGIQEDKINNTVYDLLVSNYNTKDDILRCIVHTNYDNLHCLPSDITLTNAEITLSSTMCRESRLSRIIDLIKDQYDYIVIDTPPNLGILSVNSLCASDKLVCPVHASYFNVKGLRDLINTVNLVKSNLNSNLEIMGVLLTMYNGQINLSKSIKTTLEEVFGDKLFKTVIRQDCQIQYSQDARVPIAYYNQKCRAFQDYSNFVKEVLSHE